jgi:D-alanyl-D-alanine carboxypeptidase (penicillin-binding protein 5/6)
MNEKTKELGLKNTHFVTPHGLDNEEHFCTAYELAVITDYALNNKTFAKIVNTKAVTISVNGNSRNIYNTNELLGYMQGVDGVKTGFTNGANRCIVTACRRDKMDIICVVLGCDTKNFRTQDSKKLINYIFQNFEYIDISKKANEEFEIWKQNNSNNIYVYKGISSYLKLKPSNMDNTFIPVKKKDISNINTYINISNNLRAPIYKNQVVGKLNIVSNNSSIFTLDILSDSNIEKKNLKYYFYNILKSYNQYLIFTP